MNNTSSTNTQKFFQWFPWEKLVIWILFLSLIYTLRHFFFVIFMTFIVSYTMYGLVDWIIRKFFNSNQSWWLQTIITSVCFLFLLTSIYGLGTYIVPEVVSQGQEVFKKVTSPRNNPKDSLNRFLTNSVGGWLFTQKYGTNDSEKFIKALANPERKHNSAESLSKTINEIIRGFELEQYESQKTSEEISDTNFEDKEAEAKLAHEYIINYRKNEPLKYEETLKEYFFKNQTQFAMSFPYKFEDLLNLSKALDKSNEIFYSEVLKLDAENNQLAIQLFQFSEKQKLFNEWKNGEVSKRIEKQLGDYVVSGMTFLGKEIGEIIPKLITLPMKLFLSLLLAFLIVIDVPRLKKGLLRLKTSQIKDFYAEIAPGLVNFGKLIGRAFQAQGIIAIVNTILTLLLIKILGIQNAAFLCVIVFLFSFVPVLGVVVSGLPIAVTAFIQDGGGYMLSFYSICGILLVHFIETSLLNPRIVGNMLHLHPVFVLAILAIGEHFFGVWGLLLGVPVVVYILRLVILKEGIPGLIDLSPSE